MNRVRIKATADCRGERTRTNTEKDGEVKEVEVYLTRGILVQKRFASARSKR